MTESQRATGSQTAGEVTEPKRVVATKNDTTDYKRKAKNLPDDEVLAQNITETVKQVEAAGEPVEDPGQLTEDFAGDYQRRVQLGVPANELTYEDDEDSDDEGKTGYKPEDQDKNEN
jgi:hypothetical protein